MLKRIWLASIFAAASSWNLAATRAEFPVEWTQCFAPRKQTTPACSSPWGYYQTAWRPWNSADADYHPQSYAQHPDASWAPHPAQPYGYPAPAGPIPPSYPGGAFPPAGPQQLPPIQAPPRMSPPMSRSTMPWQRLPPVVRNFPSPEETAEKVAASRPLPPHLTGEDLHESSRFRVRRPALPLESEEDMRPPVMSTGGHTAEDRDEVNPAIANQSEPAPRATRTERSYPSAPNPRRNSFGYSEQADAGPQILSSPAENATSLERETAAIPADPPPPANAPPVITPSPRPRAANPLPIITPDRTKPARPRPSQERPTVRPSTTSAEPEVWPPRATRSRATAPATSNEVWPPSALDFRR